MHILMTRPTGQLGTELLRVLAPTAEVIGLDLPVLGLTRADCADQVEARAPDWVVPPAADHRRGLVRAGLDDGKIAIPAPRGRDT
jgi:dTDP-4-dehydrorhamnose reductase